MFRNGLVPVLVVTVVAGSVALALLLYVTGSVTTLCRDDAMIPARLTYEEAHAKLLRCTQWHVVDSRPACCWVTRERRQVQELENVILVKDWHVPERDRGGVVRIADMEQSAAPISLDEEDTSYWRVVGSMHLAGDPAFVQEVADYLAGD
jgi:hypothetical protein